MNEMIRDRRSIGWNKNTLGAGTPGAFLCPPGHHCISISNCNAQKVKNQSSADVFCLLFCNSSMTADDSVTVSREKKMLRSGM